jgi:hypothetical protein
VAPDAATTTALEKDRGSNSRAIVDRETLYVKNNSLAIHDSLWTRYDPVFVKSILLYRQMQFPEQGQQQFKPPSTRSISPGEKAKSKPVFMVYTVFIERKKYFLDIF